MKRQRDIIVNPDHLHILIQRAAGEIIGCDALLDIQVARGTRYCHICGHPIYKDELSHAYFIYDTVFQEINDGKKSQIIPQQVSHRKNLCLLCASKVYLALAQFYKKRLNSSETSSLRLSQSEEYKKLTVRRTLEDRL